VTQAQGFEVRLFAAMKRKDNHDVVNAFHRLTDAAEQHVNRFPRLKRIQEQRSVLLDAISRRTAGREGKNVAQQGINEAEIRARCYY
jgi:hypothetical protein